MNTSPSLPAEDDGTRHWTEPGIYTVAPGVYRIPLPMPNDGLRAVNVYALTDGDTLVLIDSGWAVPEARERLGEALRGIGAGLGDVSRFLITHVHRDHYTMAIALRREFGGKVALGSLEEPSLTAAANPTRRSMDTQARLLVRCGAGPLLAELAREYGDLPRQHIDLWERPDEWLEPGPRTVLPGRKLEVVHTPGHTTGHVVFADEDAGLLFAGDHVLPHITPSIGFEAVPAELPLRDFLDSLRLVRAMPDRRLLPAHGPVTASVHRRVDELLDHHDRRLVVIAETVASGANTAYAAAHLLRWTRRERELLELDVFNRTLAVLETAAHLDLLVHQGRLTATDQDGVRCYATS
ncbi:MBL fold metallo-hydrolase [Amycolatopsis cihanbeyliensis]|uniref:Glyoxylase-like metal-dependent hydrolase (Beta-lactamase superfamily II) n=1 Tax=Amycolatopsis cihanbeyliensis TaxID=1128664 RepID=A0A542CUX3_AMYCI|nr:glyoxylase-like metal-dependent hydrolase (beta-lactamase superfamily II) [Amycolatopsis cihanbeyliensis]